MSYYYFDTSALAKRYIHETGTEEVQRIFSRRDTFATSILAWAEFQALTARLVREGYLTKKQAPQLLKQFAQDYEALMVVSLTAEINARITQLVVRHPLRGADAIHLASATLLAESLSLVFVCSDLRLLHAAESVGLKVLNPK